MTTTFEEANAALRQAVGTRIAAVAAGRSADQWYDPQDEDSPKPLIGDSLLASSDVHPTSQQFFDLCDALKEMHRRKSRDYGCPSGTDPLANIRNGAKFVGIPSWKAAMVRLSDKVTRLATFNATGTLHNEGVIDTLEDLASYAILARLLYEEERGG
jgi:hypothetical protein